MICYRDRTFCNAPCTNTICTRRLTQQVSEDADEFGLPVAVSDFRDTCTSYIPIREE